jgi:hypothetical protein
MMEENVTSGSKVQIVITPTKCTSLFITYIYCISPIYFGVISSIIEEILKLVGEIY